MNFWKNTFFYLGLNRDIDLFSEKILKYAISFISDKKERLNRLNSIPYIKRMKGAATREKSFGWLYLDIENYLVEKEPRKRYKREEIRKEIRKKFNPKKYPSKFAILFLPSENRLIKIFAIFIEIILIRIQRILSAEQLNNILKKSTKANFLKFVDFQKKPILWNELEKQFSKIKENRKKKINPASFIHGDFTSTIQEWDKTRNIQKRSGVNKEDYVFIHFGDFFKKLIMALEEETAREKIIREFNNTLASFKEEYGYTTAVSDFLKVIRDPKFFSDERIDALSKEALEIKVRQRTIELETAKVQLEEKAERLESTVEELRVAQEKLQSINKAKSDFIQVVSHQFRTPLSVIRWNSELIADQIEEKGITGNISANQRNNQRESAAKEIKEMLDSIRLKTIFLTEILDNIFDVLAVEGGDLALNKKPVFLWEITDDVCKEFQKTLKEKEIELDFQKSTEQLKAVSADPAKIKKVARILLTNAVNYSFSKSAITVSVIPFEKDNARFIKFSVSNKGIGIDKSDRSSIFTKFFRARNAISAVPDGAGLGLYLAKQLIEAHRGKVWFESSEKETVFHFTLPLEQINQDIVV